MKERLFRFKQFSVCHQRSAMKVGVDGVLIGAWASCAGSRILDVGCGCGLISLILAQRNPSAYVTGIDIDPPSIEEARENVNNSPWSDRINIIEMSFEKLCNVDEMPKFDALVSNPPFFKSGINSPLTPREVSRHQASLSPFSLISVGSRLLKPGGRLSLIAPAEMSINLIENAKFSGLSLQRICYVRDNEAAPRKRVMLEFQTSLPQEKYFSHQSDNKIPKDFEKNMSIGRKEKEVSLMNGELTLFEKPGLPTDAYRFLCGDFYLRF